MAQRRGSRSSTLCLPTLLAVFLAISMASAAPLAAVEGVDFGDTSGASTALGALDAGLNTITGVLPITPTFGMIDIDYFTVTTPVGLIVTSIQIIISKYNDFAPGSSAWQLLGANSGSAAYNGDGTFGLSGLALADPSTLAFEVGGVDGQFDDDTYNYRVEINVTTPEPDTWIVVATGVLAIGAGLRRQRV